MRSNEPAKHHDLYRLQFGALSSSGPWTSRRASLLNLSVQSIARNGVEKTREERAARSRGRRDLRPHPPLTWIVCVKIDVCVSNDFGTRRSGETKPWTPARRAQPPPAALITERAITAARKLAIVPLHKKEQPGGENGARPATRGSRRLWGWSRSRGPAAARLALVGNSVRPVSRRRRAAKAATGRVRAIKFAGCSHRRVDRSRVGK